MGESGHRGLEEYLLHFFSTQLLGSMGSSH